MQKLQNATANSCNDKKCKVTKCKTRKCNTAKIMFANLNCLTQTVFWTSKGFENHNYLTCRPMSKLIALRTPSSSRHPTPLVMMTRPEKIGHAQQTRGWANGYGVQGTMLIRLRGEIQKHSRPLPRPPGHQLPWSENQSKSKILIANSNSAYQRSPLRAIFKTIEEWQGVSKSEQSDIVGRWCFVRARPQACAHLVNIVGSFWMVVSEAL